MLSALHIQDFLLIEQASLPLKSGLTALTGETGAGKSILLEALGLACGGRAERTRVRAGAKQGSVTVAFEPDGNHPVWSVLEENGLEAEDDQIILRRVQNADGRGRAFINDRPVSIALLRQIGDTLLEIHGQHDGRGFLSASAHLALLDEYARCVTELTSVRSAWQAWQTARDALEEKHRDRERVLREADYLRHVFEELTKLAPQTGEDAELAQERAAMMANEKVAESLRQASEAIDDDALENRFARAARELEKARQQTHEPHIPLEKAVETTEAALSAIMEARASISDLTQSIDLDQDQLARVEERLFALRAAARKYGVSADGLAEYLEQVSSSLALLDADELAFGDLERAVKDNKANFEAVAQTLSDKRHRAAKRLDKAVAKELAPLKLGAAQFHTQIDTDPAFAGPNGIDRGEFMVATNPGAPAGPLKSIASGGELSRFVLAMKAALAAKENRTVIIFDEVDAGVGGAVADAVGERLAALAHNTQVLVVTHSPQVAARAASHWEVSKDQRARETITQVRVLSQDERIEEIARMLSGAEITDEARAAARRLIEGKIEKPTPTPSPRKRKKAS